MPSKVRVYEIARELGLSNAEIIDLCNDLGIGVKSHSSSIVEPQADRIRRKAERDGLKREPGSGHDDGPDGDRTASPGPTSDTGKAAPAKSDDSHNATATVSSDTSAPASASPPAQRENREPAQPARQVPAAAAPGGNRPPQRLISSGGSSTPGIVSSRLLPPPPPRVGVPPWPAASPARPAAPPAVPTPPAA
ncbi:MAG: translation initiation factor IF-2 N-terminal domain-containing protein, partial [Actinomycetota bacterium]|nr:translation initiation factor IF-2 N-terminal domain-containing protein [Actinomycetota bacterium]